MARCLAHRDQGMANAWRNAKERAENALRATTTMTPLGGAVDIRASQVQGLMEEGDMTLARRKYLWLLNHGNLMQDYRAKVRTVSAFVKKTSRVWPLKETAMRLWHYRNDAALKKARIDWLQGAFRSRRPPMRAKGADDQVPPPVDRESRGVGITNAP